MLSRFSKRYFLAAHLELLYYLNHHLSSMNQKSYIWGVAHPERKIIIPLCSASVGPHNLGRKEENNVRSREKDPLSDHHAVFGLTLTKSGKIVWTERFLILKERTLFHDAVFGLTLTIGRKKAETIEKELNKEKIYDPDKTNIFLSCSILVNSHNWAKKGEAIWAEQITVPE